MIIYRNRIAALAASVMSVFCSETLSANTLQFGVVGSPIDLSANVREAILPGGTVFQQSNPLFGTEPDPKQSAELLHSRKGASTLRGARRTFPTHSHRRSPNRMATAALASARRSSAARTTPTRTLFASWSRSRCGHRRSSTTAHPRSTSRCICTFRRCRCSFWACRRIVTI